MMRTTCRIRKLFPYPGDMEPRWLSDDEQAVWRAFLSMDKAVRRALARQLAVDSDMPVTYYEILVQLSEAPGRTLRMTELAVATEGTQSQLSHAVNRLQERGWVERQRCMEDGRGWYAVLTDDGMAALAEAAPGHVECVRSVLFDPLSPEQVRQLGIIDSTLAEAAAKPQFDAVDRAPSQ